MVNVVDQSQDDTKPQQRSGIIMLVTGTAASVSGTVSLGYVIYAVRQKSPRSFTPDRE